MKLIKNLMMFMFVAFTCTYQAANAQQGYVELIEPGPISLPAGKPYTLDEVRKAVLLGAMRRDWRVVSDSPGTVRIVLDRRADGAELVMDVVYDTTSFSIKYISSQNLHFHPQGATGPAGFSPRYSGGYAPRSSQNKPTIHSSYARWMKNLTNSINVELVIVKL